MICFNSNLFKKSGRPSKGPRNFLGDNSSLHSLFTILKFISLAIYLKTLPMISYQRINQLSEIYFGFENIDISIFFGSLFVNISFILVLFFRRIIINNHGPYKRGGGSGERWCILQGPQKRGIPGLYPPPPLKNFF